MFPGGGLLGWWRRAAENRLSLRRKPAPKQISDFFKTGSASRAARWPDRGRGPSSLLRAVLGRIACRIRGQDLVTQYLLDHIFVYRRDQNLSYKSSDV
jgi:hypothetical protein